MKKISIPVNNLRNYIELFNGIFNLTDSEINVLTEFVRMKLSLDKNDKVDINPFSAQIKKKVADILNRDDFNSLNTYIKRLKDKGAIKPTNDGYEIHRILVPTEDDIIQIRLK